MSTAPSMPLFVDAYLADTTHLSTEEHGAYLLLLMAIWRRNGAVPDDDRDLARILGLSGSKWRAIKLRLMPFLTIENGEITQKRLQKEWEYIAERREQNARNGARGGRPRKNENNDLAKAKGSVSVSKNKTQKKPNPDPTPDPEEKNGANAPRDLLGNLSLPTDPDQAAMAVAMWNDLAGKHGLAKVQAITERRRSSLKARLKEAGGLAGWAVAMGHVEKAPFLLGQKTDFKADFDFLLQQKSFTKLMEGGYAGGPAREREASPTMAILRRMANGE